MDNKENVGARRRSSVPTSLGVFVNRRPLASLPHPFLHHLTEHSTAIMDEYSTAATRDAAAGSRTRSMPQTRNKSASALGSESMFGNKENVAPKSSKSHTNETVAQVFMKDENKQWSSTTASMSSMEQHEAIFKECEKILAEYADLNIGNISEPLLSNQKKYDLKSKFSLVTNTLKQYVLQPEKIPKTAVQEDVANITHRPKKVLPGWAPVAQPRKLFNYDISEEESRTHQEFKLQLQDDVPSRDLWLKLYQPYLEESIKLQVAKEVLKPEVQPACARKIRTILVDWITMLQNYLRQRTATLHIAVRIFDEVLSICEVETKDLQLVAIAVFWIACKLDSQGTLLSASQLLSKSKMSYSRHQLCRTEFHILRVLNFHTPQDTPLSIVTYLISKLQIPESQESKVRHIACYLLDVSLLSWRMSFERPSYMASAATLCSLALLGHRQYLPACSWGFQQGNTDINWMMMSHKYTTFVPLSAIDSVVTDLLCMLLEVHAENSEYDGIKYKHQRLRSFYKDFLTEEAIKAAMEELTGHYK